MPFGSGIISTIFLYLLKGRDEGTRDGDTEEHVGPPSSWAAAPHDRVQDCALKTTWACCIGLNGREELTLNLILRVRLFGLARWRHEPPRHVETAFIALSKWRYDTPPPAVTRKGVREAW